MALRFSLGAERQSRPEGEPVRLVKWLLQEFFEVFRWREEWTFFDWISKTLAGKTVVTATAAVVAVVLAALSQHPLITSAAAGALGTSLLILIWDLFSNRVPKRSEIETGGFVQLNPANAIGPMSGELIDLEHHWNQCQRAYSATQVYWNRMLHEARATRARKELSLDERATLSSEQISTGLDRVFRSTTELVERIHQLNQFVGDHFSGWRDTNDP